MTRRQQILWVALTVGVIIVLVIFFLGVGLFLIIVTIGVVITAILIAGILVLDYISKKKAKK